MKPLRYGIIGGGFIAGFQLRALSQVRGIEVAGFISKDPVDDLCSFVKENRLGEGKKYATIKEMVQDVDVVAIFAPNFARLEITEEVVSVVKSGAKLKGIVCEKPLGRNLTECRRMIELAKEANLKTVYFENQVHMKTIRAHREQLTPVMNAMGPPLLVRSNEEHAGPHKGWFWNPTQQGGGVMSDMGCHCLAVGWHLLTPPGKSIRFLKPVSVLADLSLLKWGQPRWKKQLLDVFGVDYDKTPAEDFATGMVTYLNPDTGALSKAQFTVSWMFDKQGLRLFYDGLGPGYAFEMNTLRTPLEVFVGDIASSSVADAEGALEKLQASKGLLTVQQNEADLYGYTDEHVDIVDAFARDREPMLDWEFGLEICRLNLAAYMSAERKYSIDLTDPKIIKELDTYIPLIQQGLGREVL